MQYIQMVGKISLWPTHLSMCVTVDTTGQHMYQAHYSHRQSPLLGPLGRGSARPNYSPTQKQLDLEGT